jgi:hypothetical protein
MLIGLSINLSTIADMPLLIQDPEMIHLDLYSGFGIKPNFDGPLRNIQWKMKGYERQAKLLTDQLVEMLDNTLRSQRDRLASQRTTIAFSSAKLQYLSQNHLRGTAYVIVLFLPGIFVSVSPPPSPICRLVTAF